MGVKFMVKFISLIEVVNVVEDNFVIGIFGFVGLSVFEGLIKSLEERFFKYNKF